MLPLLKKEIFDFLNSLIGYVVVIVFLTTISLFMWIFPGDLNVFDSGFADINTLFIIAPWVFMFLAPAITMKSFSEEFRTGTIELLLTRPLTDWQIVIAKNLAGLLLVLFAIIPTLIYYYSINQLASPIGNVDSGGFWGSFIGLIFLSATFVSIGLFASSITSSQIVSFLTGIFITFFCFVGFESIAGLDLFGSFDLFISQLGINAHYVSMSRGVFDSRDAIYFLSVIAFFLILTKFRLGSRRW